MLDLEVRIREAELNDIPRIQEIRRLVKENILSDPNKVSDQMCKDYLFNRGKGWVSLYKEVITGFCIIDIQDNEVWALFVHPDFEGKGIGTLLQKVMLDYFFALRKSSLVLGTESKTRAEKFYTQSGWVNMGLKENGEVKFELSYTNYLKTQV